ncbi:MAG: ABC transporter permease [Bacteroidales bacterium]|jgi:putative ABC transport system permease protein|nr:ABC transporter permease [Bacteroidales bacterium]
MIDTDKFKEIWQTITRNKTRSMLTAFGVFWGMFMFIVLIGIGKGFETGLKENIGNIAPNSMFVFGGQTSIAYKGLNAGRYWRMNNEDLEILKKQLPEIEYISGMVFAGNSAKTTHNERSGDFSYRGNDHIYYHIEPQTIIYGRVFNHIDLKEKRKVCLLGNKVYDQLFNPGEDPIGQTICMGGIYYQVIGVVKPSGNINFGGDGGSTIYIPTTTLQQLFNRGNDLDILAIAAGDDVNIKDLEKKVSMILKIKHRIAPEDQKAVNTFNLQDMFLMFKYLFLGIKILIWIVGMGTLLAGVIGISNIMLVSVKERTNEIGIKRALGAKPRVITSQIMWESLMLTFLAGFVGMFFGILILVVTETFVKDAEMFSNPTISFTMAVVSAIIIILSGLIAGIIPAKSAIKIKAIDALRDE